MATVFVGIVLAGFSYLNAVIGENRAQSRLALEGRVDIHIQTVHAVLLKAQEPLNTLADNLAVTHGDISTFPQFAPYLLSMNSGVSGLFLAPGGLVTLAEPLRGNEAAIGHDLLKDPERRKEVEEAVSTNATVLAGPVTMRQGGVGLFARKPVFWMEDGTRRFWGLAVALIKWDAVKQLMDFDSLGAAGYARHPC
jgi:sensor domain CHASE-containing protein